MKKMLPLASALLALSSAAHAVVGTVYRPLPYPCDGLIVDCPDIVPLPYPHPYPFPRPKKPWEPRFEIMTEQVGAISASVAEGDVAAASGGLDAFFSGSGAAPAGGASFVHAVERPEDRTIFNPVPEQPADGSSRKGWSSRVDVPAPRFQKVGAEGALIGGAIGGIATGGSAVGAGGGAYIGDKVQDAASGAIDRYVNRDQTKESIEKYGGSRLKGK